jgi:hypothetical protein
MTRTILAAAALLCSPAFARAQTAPSSAAPLPAGAIEDLVLPPAS